MQLYNGDCLEVMKSIPNKSIDLILCDLPYGITKCKWDTPIDLFAMWNQYNRIIKDNGAIALFANGEAAPVEPPALAVTLDLVSPSLAPNCFNSML